MAFLETQELGRGQDVNATQIPVRIWRGKPVEMCPADRCKQERKCLSARDIREARIDRHVHRPHGESPSCAAVRRALSRNRVAAS